VSREDLPVRYRELISGLRSCGWRGRLLALVLGPAIRVTIKMIRKAERMVNDRLTRITGGPRPKEE
jgi:hypothetical protein